MRVVGSWMTAICVEALTDACETTTDQKVQFKIALDRCHPLSRHVLIDDGRQSLPFYRRRVAALTEMSLFANLPPQTPFQRRLTQLSIDSLVSLTMTIGTRLGLFDALEAVGSETEPATSAQVAEKAGLKERYVREWLATMGTGGIIEIAPGPKYWIPKENAQALSPKHREFIALGPAIVENFSKALDHVTEAFKKDGPYGVPYSVYTDFYPLMNDITESLHRKHFIPDFMPQIPDGIETRLKEGGIKCLDVGCGSGFHPAMLAEAYPKSYFTGLDIGEEAVRLGRLRQRTDNTAFTNLEFILSDAGAMPVEWTETFDWITLFDSCHDQQRADKSLKEIFRVLKRGSMFCMLEIRGTSDPFKDKELYGELASVFYGISTMHCLPIGSNAPDALGLGTVMGEVVIRGLLKDAGFEDVTVLQPTCFPINQLFIARKH